MPAPADEFLADLARRLAEAAPDACFVGGCVRDCLRGLPLKDVDVVLPGDPWEVGRRVARPFRGALFWLREEERVARVVFPRQAGFQLDLAPLTGSLEDDLRARDFTVNALAAPVSAGLCPPEESVIDPAGGRADLRAKRLRFCAPDAPERDPLRTLRAVRFKHQLQFRLDPATEQRVRECAPLLHSVSRERIRDEFFLLLAAPTASAGIGDLADFGLWAAAVPDAGPAPAGEGSPAAVLAALVNSEGWTPDEPALWTDVGNYLARQISAPRTYRLLLRWAAVAWPLVAAGDGIDLPLLGRLNRGLRLSGREGEFVGRALAGAEEALALAARWPVLPRERFHLFRRAREAGPGAILLAAARAARSAWPELLAEALRRLDRPQAPLVDGREVMRLLRLKPGPWIGRLLEAVEEERADGRLATREEARAWLRQEGPRLAREAGAPVPQGETDDR